MLNYYQTWNIFWCLGGHGSLKVAHIPFPLFFYYLIASLPLSHSHSVIMVVVDCLSKYGNFTALSHPYTTATIAQLFVSQIFKLYGMPTSIISY
jgi:hypothetical protein